MFFTGQVFRWDCLRAIWTLDMSMTLWAMSQVSFLNRLDLNQPIVSFTQTSINQDKRGYCRLILLFPSQNIYCGRSKEPSQWDGSFVHPKYMFIQTVRQLFCAPKIYVHIDWCQDKKIMLLLCLTSHQSLGHMETGPQLKVSSDRLVKPVIEPATPGLQGKRFIHYTTAAHNHNFVLKMT